VDGLNTRSQNYGQAEVVIAPVICFDFPVESTHHEFVGTDFKGTDIAHDVAGLAFVEQTIPDVLKLFDTPD
jgi:hypothetical protein